LARRRGGCWYAGEVCRGAYAISQRWRERNCVAWMRTDGYRACRNPVEAATGKESRSHIAVNADRIRYIRKLQSPGVEILAWLCRRRAGAGFGSPSHNCRLTGRLEGAGTLSLAGRERLRVGAPAPKRRIGLSAVLTQQWSVPWCERVRSRVHLFLRPADDRAIARLAGRGGCIGRRDPRCATRSVSLRRWEEGGSAKITLSELQGPKHFGFPDWLNLNRVGTNGGRGTAARQKRGGVGSGPYSLAACLIGRLASISRMAGSRNSIALRSPFTQVWTEFGTVCEGSPI
jgi:hypothetical protein